MRRSAGPPPRLRPGPYVPPSTVPAGEGAMWDTVPRARRRHAGRHGPSSGPILVEAGGADTAQDGAGRNGAGRQPARLSSREGLHLAAPGLSPVTVSHLGERLRAYYADTVSEPAPERFSRLLGRLDALALSPHDEDA